MIPSFFIRKCRVERFIPSRAAAPCGPATTQFVSFKIDMMCSRSASLRVLPLVSSSWYAMRSQSGEWYAEHRTRRKDHRALDYILQLTDISGPRVPNQRFHRF